MRNTKLVTTLFFISMIVFSCHKDNDDDVSMACNVLNPVEDLEWLRNKIEELEQSEPEELKYLYFSEKKYNEQTIFVLYSCDPLINYMPYVYNCEGEPTGITTDEYFIFIGSGGGKIIWKPDNSICY